MGLIPVRSYDRYRDGKLEEVSAYTRRGVIQAKPRNNNRSVLNSMWEAAATQLMALDPGNPELDKTLDPNWMPETADVADIWEALEDARASVKGDGNGATDQSVENNINFPEHSFDKYNIDDIAFLQDAKKFHDLVEENTVQELIREGCIVERQVPFTIAGTNITTIPDILARCPYKNTKL
jgi:hypothetical protein